jgi:molybdenum cofactor cytidylyltransferase
MLSAILLAAGSSRRMGADNKLLLPWQNKPIVAATAATLLAAGFEEVIVVTGHQAPEITAAIHPLPVSFVHNPLFETGMTSSIQAGVRKAAGKGYMICLADMVLITAAEYALLKNAWEKRYALDDHCIGIPEFGGEKGNPVILPAALREEILLHSEKEGCKDLVRTWSKHHLRIPMPTDHILRDIDRPEDYDGLTGQHEP